MNVARTLAIATGGHKTVPNDWVSATALRPLLQDDPALAWFRYHGHKYGFQQDASDYSFLNWISEIATKFEEEWVRRMAPYAVRANERDTDVTNASAVQRTLKLMSRPDVDVIAKAALWLAPIKAYGTADLIARASWLRKTFPQLSGYLAKGRDHWVVFDAKYMTQLDSSSKSKSLRLASSQVRLYSYILGQLQGVMPSHAFLITRDQINDPLPVCVEHELDGPLDAMLHDLIAECRHIRLFGGHYTPWTCSIVRPDWTNKEEAPWSNAKRRILEEFWPHTPLETLPGVGTVQAVSLQQLGFHSVENLLRCDPQGKSWADKLPGFGDAKTRRLQAVLYANHSGRPTRVPMDVIPKKRPIELMVDFEYLSSCRADFNKWPDLSGAEMVFMIGCGWEENGRWRFRRFTASEESAIAEQKMWCEFLSFLRDRGVNFGFVNSKHSLVSLFHWSSAERVQARRAAERLNMPELAMLPWMDLRQSFVHGEIALPGCWGLGLKEVAKAVGELSPEFQVRYPDGLNAGLDAMVMGWRAYEQAEPLQTKEMKLIGRYLEADCQSLLAVLRWLRSAVNVERRQSAISSPREYRQRKGAWALTSSNAVQWCV